MSDDPQLSTPLTESMIPEDLRGEGSLTNFKDQPIGNLVKSYVETKKMSGSRVPLPNMEDPKSIEEFVTKVRPKAHTDYTATLPEEIQPIPEAIESIKKKAHEVGVMDFQLKAIFDEFGNITKSRLEQAGKDNEAANLERKAALSKLFGEGDVYNKAMATANRGIKAFANENMQKKAKELGLLEDPDFAQCFHRIGNAMTEDVFVAGQATTNNFMTAEAALDKAKAMLEDKEHPINNPTHPGHREAIKERERLLAMTIQK